MARDYKDFNLPAGQRAERKALITVAEWKRLVTPAGGGDPTEETVRELLGTRVEDSSIEYNPDIETTTDILGNNYTDLNKTQPSQSFDTMTVLGGAKLLAMLNDIRRRNAVAELNQFKLYVITTYCGSAGAYEAERHDDCTITYDSLGGDVRVQMPITAYFSNKITTGTVDKLADDFTFTEDATV